MTIDWRDPDGRPDRTVTALAVLRWTAAAVFVVAAHGAAAWMLLHKQPAMASTDPPAAVMIELAPLAVAPEDPPQEMAPGPQAAAGEPEPPLDPPEKPLEPPEEKPEPVVEEVARPVEDVPPVPQPQVEIPKLPEKPEAEAVLTSPPPQPKAQKKPPPKAKKVERKEPAEHKKQRAAQTTAPPTSRAQRSNTAAAPFASTAQAPSVSPASWRGALNAHLNRYKRFPGGAGSGGVVQIAFTIDRSGRVLSSRLLRSSGNPALDQEAVSLPRRASPVPAPPPNVGGNPLTLAVPIRFNR